MVYTLVHPAHERQAHVDSNSQWMTASHGHLPYLHSQHRCSCGTIPSDLRVLGKGDFRQLIKWRLRLVAYRDELRALEGEDDGEVSEDGEETEHAEPMTAEEKEEEVQAEIKALQ